MEEYNIPKQLDALIKEYLTDGVLTPKEREVILKKAERIGLDRDEIDLYLDAQVQKIEQELDAANRKRKGKSCPFCGAPVPQLADKCPVCEQFITPEASKELQDILDRLEDALVDFKSGRNTDRSKASVERYARRAKMYYSNNPKIKPLLAEVEGEMSKIEKKIKSKQRSEILATIIKNKFVWVGLPIIIGVLLVGRCCVIQGDHIDGGPAGLGLLGVILAFGGVFALMVMDSNNDKDNKKDEDNDDL